MQKVFIELKRSRTMEKITPYIRRKASDSVTTMLAESNPNRGIFDELTERLGNIHESVRALVDCLQTRDVIRVTD